MFFVKTDLYNFGIFSIVINLQTVALNGSTLYLFVHYYKPEIVEDSSALLSFALGNEKTLVTCKFCEALLKDLHTTSFLSFPNANEQILIFMLKRWKTLKSRKSNVSFSVTWPVLYWKIFATVFLCFIAGECHGSVNIHLWMPKVFVN